MYIDGKVFANLRGNLALPSSTTAAAAAAAAAEPTARYTRQPCICFFSLCLVTVTGVRRGPYKVYSHPSLHETLERHRRAWPRVQ